MQLTAALGVITWSFQAEAAIASVEGANHHHHRPRHQNTSLTNRIRQDEASSSRITDKHRELDQSKSLQPDRELIEEDPFLQWLKKQSEIYGCPPAYEAAPAKSIQKYYKGDKVSTCNATGINCIMYQCKTDDSRCQQIGLEPGVHPNDSPLVVWEELASCSTAPMHETLWCQREWKIGPWYSNNVVVSNHGIAYRCVSMFDCSRYDSEPGVTTTRSNNGWEELGACSIYIAPSEEPSATPSMQPSGSPTVEPTVVASESPSATPSVSPSGKPTSTPSASPSTEPSTLPTAMPSSQPTPVHSESPSASPSASPTTNPTSEPSGSPSESPSGSPSSHPTSKPSATPSTTPSASPSSYPTSTPSSSPSVKPSASPSSMPSSHPTSEPSASPSVEPSAFPSSQPTISPSSAPSAKPSASPSSMPSSHPTSEPSASPSVEPSASPSSQPTSTPSSSPSATPTTMPSSMPSSHPTSEPSASPSAKPTASPSSQPTSDPSSSPSSEPTTTPSAMPSSHPTSQPSASPSAKPSASPSSEPTSTPSSLPSAKPSSSPSATPSYHPTSEPSASPSANPTAFPSSDPSSTPTTSPSEMPTAMPSLMPSSQPTVTGSVSPSVEASASPSSSPSSEPSATPSASPSGSPSSDPTSEPSAPPSVEPSASPSSQPTSTPSASPSTKPSSSPSAMPSSHPTSEPSASPSVEPSAFPSSEPTSEPSSSPSSKPTAAPSSMPSSHPTSEPSAFPSISPTSQPSGSPSSQPTSDPSSSPSSKPTTTPSSMPSSYPTSQPSASPSAKPSASPSSEPTSTPTSEPSSSPSASPTTSPPTAFPSAMPSAHPSGSPSSQPTSTPSSSPSSSPSSEPTGSPSSTPTLSAKPSVHILSDAPSTTILTSSFSTSVVFADISEFMDKKTFDTVGIVTKRFIEKALADRDAECDVEVTSQRLESDEPNNSKRSLRVQITLSSGLAVDLDFSCTATRRGDNVDIEKLILSELGGNAVEYKQLLADNASFFIHYNQREDQMLANPAMATPQGEPKSGAGRKAGIVFGFFGSLFVIAVSLYKVWERRRSNEPAPRRVIHEEANEFYDLRPSRRALTVIKEDENDAYDLNAISATKNDNVANGKPQNSEQQPRKDVVTQKLGMMSDAIKSKNKSEEEDEKTSRSFLPDKLKDTVKRGMRDVWIYADNDDGKDLGQYPVVSDLSDPSDAEGVLSPTSQGGYLDNGYYQNAADKMVGDQFDTRAIMTPFAPRSSRNGLLGAGSRQGPPVTAYSFSSPTSTAARSYRSFKKDKVFEVYAPPGPLGVIIDTSKEGPLIHSLRKDSQLKDLVNPGDLIVALDDEDTRHMTAAKLTRKMASKSGETRKITLLKGLAPETPIASGRNAPSFQSPLAVRNAPSFQSPHAPAPSSFQSPLSARNAPPFQSPLAPTPPSLQSPLSARNATSFQSTARNEDHLMRKDRV